MLLIMAGVGCQTRTPDATPVVVPHLAPHSPAGSVEVQLHVVVKPDGSIKQVSVQRSSGFPNVDDIARGKILERWKWPPAKRERAFVVPISFHAGDPKQPLQAPGPVREDED